MAHHLIRASHLVDFHQKGLDDEFLHAARLPEHALGVNIKMKVSRPDRAQRAGLLRCFALGGLAMREPRVGRTFREVDLFPPFVFTSRNSTPAPWRRKHTAATCSGNDFGTRAEAMPAVS